MEGLGLGLNANLCLGFLEFGQNTKTLKLGKVVLAKVGHDLPPVVDMIFLSLLGDDALTLAVCTIGMCARQARWTPPVKDENEEDEEDKEDEDEEELNLVFPRTLGSTADTFASI